MRTNISLWFGLSAVVLALGCEDQAGDAASASATAKAAGAATGAAKPAETADKKAEKKAANKTVKAADLNEAYEGIFNDLKTMKDPMENKVAAFIAKIGEPAKTDGDKKIWYAVDGDKCESAVLGADGALTQTSVDKAECGL
jgi:hypothetical protein